MTTYLVSGDPDILPTHINLRRTGRRVRHDTQVLAAASKALRQGGRYVVIAHGDRHGRVLLARSDWGTPQLWLYKDMPQPPTNTRVYLYACFAGKVLPRTLRASGVEAFGHIEQVPVPTGNAEPIVLSFLDKVDQLLATAYDRTAWQRELVQFVNAGYTKEVNNPTSTLGAAYWLLLRRSLGAIEG